MIRVGSELSSNQRGGRWELVSQIDTKENLWGTATLRNGWIMISQRVIGENQVLKWNLKEDSQPKKALSQNTEILC